MRIFSVLILFLLPYVLHAQNIREWWTEMPESIVPLLSENNRLDMVDFIDSKMRAEVRNRFDGVSVMDTLGTDFLHCTMTKKSSIDMQLLINASGDTLIAVVNTVSVPQKISTLRVYNRQWILVENVFTMPDIKNFVVEGSEQAIIGLEELPMVEICPEGIKLTLLLDTTNIDRDTRKKLKVRPLQMKWNGKKFELI